MKIPGCVSANNRATLQDALTAADANAGHDVIRLGADTFTGPFTAAEGDVDIVGSGRATVLTADPGNSKLILDLENASKVSNVSNLSVAIPNGSSNKGIQLSTGKVTDVFIGGGTQATNAIGIIAAHFLPVFVNRSVVALGGTGSTAIDVLTGDIDVRDSALNANLGISALTNETIRVVRSAITANIGVDGGTGCLAADSSLFQLRGVSARGLTMRGGAPCFTLGTSPLGAITLDARHLTIVGDGSAGSVGIEVASTGDPIDASVTSTVVRGTSVSFKRTAAGAGASARLRIRYSLFGAALAQSGAPGNAEGSSNVPGNPDPLFASPTLGDYTPLPTSPLLDAGDPRDLFPGESAFDMVFRPRRALGGPDIGAFERQSLPPGPDRTAPKLKILTSSARLTRKGELKVRISCPKTETEGCVGNSSAASASKLRLKRKARKRTLKLGSRRFEMAAGKSKVVVIKVAKTARKEIAKRKKLRVKVSVAATDDAGNVGRVSRTLTVRPPKPAKKKK